MEQPDIPRHKAHELLNKQLAFLQDLKGKNYQLVSQEEDQWQLLTERIIVRAFGSESTYVSRFLSACRAGVYRKIAFHGRIDHHRNQRNFGVRINACETVLKGCIAELELDLPRHGGDCFSRNKDRPPRGQDGLESRAPSTALG